MDCAKKDMGFLNLTLGVNNSDDSDCCSPKKNKRKCRDENIIEWDLNESCEGKIFNLLEMREQMLNLEKSKKVETCADNGKGLHLLHSLIISATCVDEKEMNSAVDNLQDLYQNISLFGDSLQRVASYFADGLIAKLLTRKSPFYNMIMENPTPEEEFLAYTEFYKVSPLHQFSHFTANQTIIEAYEEEVVSNNRSLHVVDFDILYGFQWPSLIESLAQTATSDNPVSLKITGFGRSVKELKQTESRLKSFAKEFRNHLVFEFHGLLRGSNIRNITWTGKKNETIAVNLMLHMNTLETLKDIHLIHPSVVVMVEQEGNRFPEKFLTGFLESLHYFAAMFDSLDECLPANSDERGKIEKNLLGNEIKNVMNINEKNNWNCSTNDKKIETWTGRMESNGFKASKLSSKCWTQAKLLLKIRSNCSPVQLHGENGGFTILEKDEGNAISLGWQDRRLITISSWHAIT